MKLSDCSTSSSTLTILDIGDHRDDNSRILTPFFNLTLIAALFFVFHLMVLMKRFSVPSRLQ